MTRIALNVFDAPLLLGFLGPSCLGIHVHGYPRSGDAGQREFPGGRRTSRYLRLHPTISNATRAEERRGQLSASHDSWLGLLAGYSGHGVNADRC